MAVAERTYQDPTANMITALMNMGGKKETSTTSTSVDPAATAGLQQVLNNQLSATTPEGAAELLRAIFTEGMKQVPGLATTYGQAAGARTANNTPFQLALQDMMTKLTLEANKQLSANQQAAGNTAAQLAQATRAQTTTSKTAPRASFMQALPFLAANSDKLKKVLDSVAPGISDKVSGIFSTDRTPEGINFNGNAATGTSDPLSLASDFGSGVPSDTSSVGGDASTGMGFDPSVSAGFFGDAGNGLDFASGAADLGISTDLVDPSVADSIFSGFSFAKGGIVRAPSKMAMMPGCATGGIVKKNMRAPGYATGGQVKSVGGNTATLDGGKINRGVTYNNSPEDSMALARALMLAANPAIPNSPITPSERTPNRGLPNSESAGESSEGSGIATGEVGTPEGNANAVAGAVGMGLGMTMGPVAGLASAAVANAMGLSPTSMNPVAAIVNAIVNTMTVGAPSVDGALNSIQDDAMATLGITNPSSLQDQNSAFDAASVGDAPGEGGGIGGTGNSAGDAGAGDGGNGSAGDGSGSDGGSATAATGGEINGPGTPTSDSIPVRLSDGEYVINANAVNALGQDFFDMINHVMFPSDAAKKPMMRH